MFTNTPTDLDLAQCEAEPIRIPGAIQPHGWLFAFEDGTFVLRHASDNVSGLLGRDVQGILGAVLSDWLEPDDATGVAEALHPTTFLTMDELRPLTLQGALYQASVHRIESLVILELERFVPALGANDHLLARALRRLQGARDLPELHEVAVREVRELTGCDRVVIYAFGRDGHGRVLAEAKAGDVAPYLHLQFPASDIPAQARELYRLNWLRMIPDVDYVPVPIWGRPAAGSAVPLDLTFSLLRSVSPIHREYMRNMGTQSSISISLLRGGELWGLISCTHRTPKYLPHAVRSACLAIGQLLSLQISALESLQETLLVEQTQPLLTPLVEHMRQSARAVLDSLAEMPTPLLLLTGATGAAIVNGDEVTLFGVCPAKDQVLALAQWAAPQAGAGGLFATAALALIYEPAAAFAEQASGLLFVLLPKPVPDMVLWFRPEVATTVAWAGDPRKVSTLEPDTRTVRLSPRHSFEAWKVLVRYQAAPWLPHDLHAARELRRCAIEIDLAAQVVRAENAVTARDELVAVVSHDLRTPLSTVSLGALLMVRTLVNDTSVPARRLLAAAQSMQRATARMDQMLRDLLDLAAIEQGRYNVNLTPCPVDALFQDAGALLTPLAEGKRITLCFAPGEGLVAHVDQERFHQVIGNLVVNSLKFTPEGGRVDVAAGLDAASQGRLLRFSVKDSGVGMSPEQMSHIFERYWRVRDANPTGTGLGLYIARGLVEAHGGTIWVESELGVGTTMYFTLQHAAY